VDHADYQGVQMKVVAVSETGTDVQWTLLDPRTHTTIHPVGDLTSHLSLFVQTVVFDPSPNQTETYALQFHTRSAPPPRVAIAPDLRTPLAQTYDLTWAPTTAAGVATAPPVSYCFDASGKPDAVVFQQTIAVDPATGAVTRDATTAGFVTMSCWQGAPATVYDWGYDYRAGTGAHDPFYFDAGIQMKRASYCGNAQFYTVAGTEIAIEDDHHIQPATPAIGAVEAVWSPTGARCIDLDNRRHKNMGFTGSCPGRKLQACTEQDRSGQFLLDAPKSPGP
jgi:hypothetical protein